MAITNKVKPIFHQKSWETLPGFIQSASNAGGFFASYSDPTYFPENIAVFVNSTTNALFYDAATSSTYTLPSPALGGTFGAGACGEIIPYGLPGGVMELTATAGTTTSITTSLNLQKQLTGKKIRITAGPNAGNEYTISHNTTGTNSVITISTTVGTAFSASTKFILMTGSAFVFNAGTLSATSFKVFDFATNTWTSLSITGLPASWGTDGQLIRASNFDVQASGTISSATSTTCVVAGLTGTGWNYTNFEIEIVSGTGAGQFRTITAGSTSTFTVDTAWTTTPDATSTFHVHTNRRHLYLMGNAAITMYRYDIIANTWSTLAPTTALSNAPSANCMSDFVSTSAWATPNVITNKVGGQNGRFIYHWRGNGTTTLSVYDVALNSWTNTVPYGGQGSDVISATANSLHSNGMIFIQQSTTGRMLCFDVAKQELKPFNQSLYPHSTAVLGDKMFIISMYDGSDRIDWLYQNYHSTTVVQRIML